MHDIPSGRSLAGMRSITLVGDSGLAAIQALPQCGGWSYDATRAMTYTVDGEASALTRFSSTSMTVGLLVCSTSACCNGWLLAAATPTTCAAADSNQGSPDVSCVRSTGMAASFGRSTTYELHVCRAPHMPNHLLQCICSACSVRLFAATMQTACSAAEPQQGCPKVR